MKRNPHLSHLKGNYLFPEIFAKKRQYQAAHPEASLISLGIGDTTEPLPGVIAEALAEASKRMGSREGYVGYGPEQGMAPLREKIASKIYLNCVGADEVFVSDGAKCDLGRLQALFGSGISIAVQDPVYPVYVDGSLIHGVKTIVQMPCTPENHFFPDLNLLPRTDLIYFCSPNNPTGSVATREQLQQLVDFAKSNRSIIIFDAAYANFIRDPSLPKSIFEIPGARETAIEIGSFSKLAGFTGIRLAWTIVPNELTYDDGSPVKADWNRLMTTLFNGASHITQEGGRVVLDEEGLSAVSLITHFYQENAQLLKKAFEEMGYEVYGGVHAPYLWVRFKGKKSWDLFQEFMEKYQIITTPGSGFGSQGEGFLRISAFGSRENVLRAVERLKNG